MDVMRAFNFVLGILGLLSSGAGFLVPRFTTMVEIDVQQAVGERSSHMYAAAGIDAVLWLVYGAYPKESVIIFVVNLLGATLMFSYVCKIVRYCQGVEMLPHLVVPLTGALGIVCVLAYFLANIKDNVHFFSCVCAFTRGLVGVLPLFSLPLAYIENSMRRMPSLLQALLALASGIIWAGFALTGDKTDAFLLYSSLAGAISGAIQVLFHYILREQGELLEPLVA